MTHVNPSLSQVGFRGYADDAVEGSATAKADENTNWTQAVDENFRVRFVVDETAGGTENNINLQLQRNLKSAGWVNVDGASAVVRAFASSHVADEGATTRQLTSGSGTFVTGAFDESDGLAGSNNQIDFTAGGELTEVEYVVQILSADVADTDTIELRVIRSGGALEAWDQIPTVTVSETGGPTTFFENHAMTATGAPALRRTVGLVRAYAGTGAAVLARTVGLLRAITALGTPAEDHGLLFTEGHSMTGTGTPALARVTTFVRAFSYAATGAVALARTIGMGLSYAASGTAALVRKLGLGRAYAATGTAAEDHGLLFTEGHAATATGSPALTFTKIVGLLFSYTATGAAALVKTVKLTRSYAAVGSVALSKSVTGGAAAVVKRVRRMGSRIGLGI